MPPVNEEAGIASLVGRIPRAIDRLPRDLGFAASLGAAARRRVENENRVEIAVRRYEEVYRSLVDGGS